MSPSQNPEQSLADRRPGPLPRPLIRGLTPTHPSLREAQGLEEERSQESFLQSWEGGGPEE